MRRPFTNRAFVRAGALVLVTGATAMLGSSQLKHLGYFNAFRLRPPGFHF